MNVLVGKLQTNGAIVMVLVATIVMTIKTSINIDIFKSVRIDSVCIS